MAPEKGNAVDVVGWVTMDNQSGKGFSNARIKLMAGDVNKIQPGQTYTGMVFARRHTALRPQFVMGFMETIPAVYQLGATDVVTGLSVNDNIDR